MTTPTDVDGYLARVRAALDDLPPAAREELLEDLSEHLAEIAAAGLSGYAPRRPPFSTARARLQVFDTKIGPLVGTRGERLPAPPATRVVGAGGYVAGLVAVLLLNGGSAPGLIPRLGAAWAPTRSHRQVRRRARGPARRGSYP